MKNGEGSILSGEVVTGKQLGRTIGFPTANIAVEHAPACVAGVYYGACRVDGMAYRVIINIGSHPTVPEGPPTVEAHLIGYSGDLYGRCIEVLLIEYLRGETRFASIDALKEQLTRDMETACSRPLPETI